MTDADDSSSAEDEDEDIVDIKFVHFLTRPDISKIVDE